MGAMIEHFRQAIRYGSALERIWVKLVAAGADVTAPTGTPTIQYYDPDGTAIGTAVNLTQSGSTAWYYHDLNAATTATWALGLGYRAKITFVSATLTQVQHIYLDVVMWPINEPLITGAEIDTLHPSWADERHEDVTSWVAAIYQAHRELLRDLRQIKDSRGNPIYVNRVLDRGQLYEIERAYVEDIIAHRYVGETPDEMKRYAAARARLFNDVNNLIVDYDDDLTEDDGEEVSLAITFEH